MSLRNRFITQNRRRLPSSAKRSVAGLGVALIFAVSGFAHSGLAQTATQEGVGEPSVSDVRATKIVTMLMEREHLLHRNIDDQIAKRAMGQFFKSIDPMKMYFLESDYNEFMQQESQVDDLFRLGDFSIPISIFDRFLVRVNESVGLAEQWLDAEHDFTLDETMVTDRDLVEFPADENEKSERWRKRIKYDLLVEGSAKDADPEEVKTRLKKRYSMFEKRMHQMTPEDLVEMFVTAVTTSFDPHTTYMSKRTFENFMIQMRLQLEGIGATLQSNDDGYTVIKRIVPNGAADRQGELKVEDRIVAVGQGGEDEMVDVVGMKLDDVVAMIRGKAGTVVKLNVLKESGSEIETIEIVREKVELEDEAANGQVFEVGFKEDGKPFRVGVIDLPSFYSDMGGGDSRSTTTDVAKLLNDFNTQEVDALVLDLRRNGGGSLREARDCTGLFIDSGPVVQVKDPDGTVQQLIDERRGMSWDKPMVVLTSKFSASASEILAGAVKDYSRGLIVGDTTTHGKGTVQSLLDLNQLIYRSSNPPSNFGALKITMQQFYRPNGDSTQKRGVFSDLVLPSVTDHMDVAESDLDYAVEFDRVPEASHTNMNLVTPEIVESLKEASLARREASDDFKDDLRKIEKYIQFKADKTVPLNKEKFLARRKEFDAEEEDREQIEQQVNGTSNSIERDYYLDEVLKITADYARKLGSG
ncbi:MAG: carboxy terminal-processing peptidase [Pirellulaceae bacterium]